MNRVSLFVFRGLVLYLLTLLAPFTVSAQQTADLGITMSDNLENTTAGSPLTYIITVINNGASTVDGMTVVVNLRPALTNPLFTPSKGTYNAQTGAWNGFTLGVGESIFLEMKATVSATAMPGSILTTAYVLPPAGFSDPNPVNNTCADKTQIPGSNSTADLGIVKSDNQTTIAPGGILTYLITVVNNGPATLPSFTVIDRLPPYVTAAGYDVSAGQYNATTGAWTGVNFAPGESLFMQVTAQVSQNAPGGTLLLNTAYVYPPDGTIDPNSDNNACHDVTTVSGNNPPPISEVDLGITKSDNRANVTKGEDLTYTLTIVNNGPATVTSIVVIDTLPTHFVGPYTYTTRNSNGQINVGVYDPANGLWNGLNFAPGESLFLEIKGKVAANAPEGNLINMASVSPPPGYTDPKSDNNHCEDKTLVVGPGGADVQLLKTVSNAIPAPGDEVEWTIEVTNNGPETAQSVSVVDRIPIGISFTSLVSVSQGTFSVQNGTWEVGSLNAGKTASLKIKTSVNNGAPAEVKNCASAVTSSNDPLASNNESCASIAPKTVSCSCDAGVESNGEFALALAQRAFNRQFVRQEGPVSAALSKTNASILAELVPNVGPEGALPFDQTWAVDDLMTYGITKATSLYAVDYNQVAKNNRRMAGIFAAITKGHHYEHAKVTCDRFGTHTLDEVRTIEIAGNPFVLSKIMRADGQLDYAVTFTARKVGNGYLVDSRNSTVEYSLPAAKDEDVLTFEVWTLSPEKTALMVQEILKKLQARGAVTINNTIWNAPSIPRVFVRKGRYEQSKLLFEIANPTGLSTAHLTGFIRDSEMATTSKKVEMTLNLSGKYLQNIVIPTDGPIYDATFELTDGTRQGIDQLYYADGTWSYNAPHQVIQNAQLNIAPQERFIPTADAYVVERKAQFAGTLTQALGNNQVVSLFRTLKAGNTPADFSAFNAIQFTASGSGRIEFSPEKASLSGSEQYRTVFDLTSYPKTYTIRFSQLSNGTADSFTAEDLRWLSFYLLPNAGKGYPQSFDINLKDVKFIANAEPLPKAYILYPNYPNPFNPTTVIEFNVPQVSDVKVVVYDVLGREVKVLANGQFYPGLHAVVFDATGQPSGVYFYRMFVGRNALTGKMILTK